jgi:hypothetical protein
MDQRLAEIAAALARAVARVRASLTTLLWTEFAVDARAYRPEKYYMRGPGPKWREKHGRRHVYDAH